MRHSYYRGDPAREVQAPVQFDDLNSIRRPNPRAYLPEPGLVDAVNVALVLGQPLLLTGEPGTGKTQLAYNVAAELGYDEPLKFETKSSSAARDLFYTYDTLRRFHASHAGGSQKAVDYLTMNALGLAILQSLSPEACAGLGLDSLRGMGLARRSVVVIDEIDKAPRDFPNDLLNEIEHLYFRIPEIDNVEVSAGAGFRPIVIITSNSEKYLPDAFLRRCVFYNIEFPKTERLKQILLLQLSPEKATRLGESFLNDAIAYFEQLRLPETGLHKPPSTAELLGFVAVLDDAQARRSFKEQKQLVKAALGALVKNAEDQKTACAVLERF